MKIKNRIKFELELKKLKFKRDGFDDGSSYWFNKEIKYKDLQLNLYVQFKPGMLYLQIKNASNEECYRQKLAFNPYYDTIKKFKLNLRNIKSLIKKYGK